MNTPAHAVLSLLVLGSRDRPRLTGAILLGSVLPDAPMFVFYAWQRFAGTPEQIIWGSRYFEPAWQGFFDLTNSLPLVMLGLLVAWRLAAPRAQALLMSMGLHSLCDLALHHDDAHRHFFPLSDWRFASPVSYWDPRHHGEIFAVAEVTLVVVGCAWLSRSHRSRAMRGLAAGIAASYALYVGYVLLVWL